MPNRHNASLSSEALVRKARDMVTSSDLTQQRLVPMSKHQAAIRHMRKNVEEQKRRRLDAEIDAQRHEKMLRSEKEECTRMKMAIQKLQEEKEERERTVNDYEMRFSDIEKNYNFNHEYGDWYDNRKAMVSEDSIELNVVPSSTRCLMNILFCKD